jgi:hypothetical protein
VEAFGEGRHKKKGRNPGHHRLKDKPPDLAQLKQGAAPGSVDV